MTETTSTIDRILTFCDLLPDDTPLTVAFTRGRPEIDLLASRATPEFIGVAVDLWGPARISRRPDWRDLEWRPDEHTKLIVAGATAVQVAAAQVPEVRV